LVQVTLSEAEHEADQYAAAEAAADRALAADPRMTEAMIFKGRAIMERAAHGDKTASFEAARSWFQKANKVDPEDPSHSCCSMRRRSAAPAVQLQTGIAALHYASDLAPQDLGSGRNRRFQYLRDGKLAEARKALAPVAFDPHGGGYAKMARSAIEKIDAGDAAGAQNTMIAGSLSPE
jgi:tetratricopeptide (TPR) repeat protein